MKTSHPLRLWNVGPLVLAHTHHEPPVVVDIVPYPRAHDFAGGYIFWNYMLRQSERERLDCLLGLALLDSDICERLVTKRDRSLLSTFELSEETQESLNRIKANTLKDFAQAIVMATN